MPKTRILHLSLTYYGDIWKYCVLKDQVDIDNKEAIDQILLYNDVDLLIFSIVNVEILMPSDIRSKSMCCVQPLVLQ